MKALLQIILGTFLTFGCAYLAYIALIHSYGFAFILSLLGVIIGIILTLSGLMRNHRDHTHRH